MSSQNCYEKYEIIKKQNEITEQEIDSLLLDCFQSSVSYPEIAHYFSIYYYKKKELTLASKYAKLEVMYLKKRKDTSVEYENALYNVGIFSKKNDDFDQAIKYFKKVINSNITQNKVARSYGEIGKYYRRKGEFYKALEYSKKGIYLLETDTIQNFSSRRNLLSLYINTSLICDFLDNKKASQKGVIYLKKADSLVELHQNILNLNRYYSLNAAYANLYANDYLNDFDSARKYYNKNLEKALQDKDSSTIANSYINLGELYLKQKKDSTLFYLKKSLLFDKKDPINNAESYRNIANYYLQKSNYLEALKNIEKSLNWSFDQHENLNHQEPSQFQLLKISDRRNVFIALRTKIKILLDLFHQTTNKIYLEKAIKTVKISDQLVTIVLDDSFEMSTKLLWKKEASKTYTLGIRAAYILRKEEEMLHFMEKNRALLLIQTIKENVEQSRLSREIRNKKLNLKRSILKLEEILDRKKVVYNKEKDSLFELKKRYQVFNDSIKRENPNYLINTPDANELSIENIQKKLDPNTVIISYTLDTNDLINPSLYGLIISKDNHLSIKIKNTNDLIIKLNRYRNLISRPLKTKSELTHFKEIAYDIYTQFFLSHDLETFIKNKQLLIIPDISMQDIPFEAFTTNKETLKYLIEQNDISYAYSIPFLIQNANVERKTNRDFIGFAPVDFFNKSLNSLENTQKEIATINQILKGKTYFHTESTKQNFIKNSIDSKIIHLATHANSNNNPEIYFVRDTVKLHELYTYKNNADLIVLSACETNLGEINNGEGVFSLARGFFHSGANAVISSLWNANDTSTAKIMEDFYRDLDNSSSKVVALSNAKRTYLKKHSLSDISPFYWASFVLIGDTNPTFEHNYTVYYYIGFAVFFLIILFFFKIKG